MNIQFQNDKRQTTKVNNEWKIQHSKRTIFDLITKSEKRTLWFLDFWFKKKTFSNWFNNYVQLLLLFRIISFAIIKITWNWSASNEWIARVSIRATTNRFVIVNIAGGLRWANTNTRINTTFIQASQIARTFGISNALRTTIWCSSDVIWQTWTDSSLADFTTLWIGATRCWNAANNRSNGYNWMT